MNIILIINCVSKHSPVGIIVYRTCLSEIWRTLSVRHNNKLLQNMKFNVIRHKVQNMYNIDF